MPVTPEELNHALAWLHPNPNLPGPAGPVSQLFWQLGYDLAVVYELADTPERRQALELLVQAKDAAVRACMTDHGLKPRPISYSDTGIPLDRETGARVTPPPSATASTPAPWELD